MSIDTLALIGVIVFAVLMIAIAAIKGTRDVARREQSRGQSTTTSEKKREPFSFSKTLKHMLLGIIVIILLLFLAKLLLSFFSEDEKRVVIGRTVPKQVQLVDAVPSSCVGFNARKIKLEKEYSAEFCIPKGSYVRIKKENQRVGVTYLLLRRNKKWSEAYEGPGKDNHLGYATSLRMKSDTPTSVEVTISKP